VIFVAAGTTSFDNLVRAMDELTPHLPDEVIMQIGPGKYIPYHAQYFRFAPSLMSYYNAARVIVAHGGLGITMEVLHLGKPLVSVEDPNQPDRHQRDILTMMEREGHLIWCRDLCHLPLAIEQAQTQLKPYTPPECKIHLIIEAYLHQGKTEMKNVVNERM
jgi:UDP-N-acetylglucosamine transferase subunit ALG13